MSLLIFTYRKFSILTEKNNINKRLMDFRQKLLDLQNYAASVSDGIISFDEMMQSPASMFNRMSIFAQGAHRMGVAGVNASLPMVMAMNQQMTAQIPDNMKPQYMRYIQESLYRQEREKFAKVEEKRLHAEETKIQQEIAKLEDRLKSIEAEEGKLDGAKDKAIKNSAPQYA